MSIQNMKDMVVVAGADNHKELVSLMSGEMKTGKGKGRAQVLNVLSAWQQLATGGTAVPSMTRGKAILPGFLQSNFLDSASKWLQNS